MSHGIVSRLLDGLIQRLIEMKRSDNPTDVEFAERASQSISDAIEGQEELSKLQVSCLV